MRCFALLAIVVVVVAMGTGASCTGGRSEVSSEGGAPPPPPVNAALEQRALAIAAEYAAWGRVDDELRWAPFLCRAPFPGLARFSESNHAATHGQKLYSVFARNWKAYPAGPHAGQAVVKEAWTAELVTDPSVKYQPELFRAAPDAGGDNFYPYVRKGDALYRAGQRADLFLMFTVDPAPPHSDEGWVYATVSPGRQVTSLGRVGSCMGCHQEAKHHRLFGVPTAPLPLPPR